VVSEGAALHARARGAAGGVRGRVLADRLFLSDHERTWLDGLGLREGTDTVHDPYRPAAFTLYPDLTIHAAYNGYWFWGRPTAEELRLDMRAISAAIRPEWELA
jgi:hypothetical protein